MNDELYLERLTHMNLTLAVLTASRLNNKEFFAYFRTVGLHWFLEIAPEKNQQYGVECWERLGSKALVADLSACYYRHKRLMTYPFEQWNKARWNVIWDSFGYAVIYTVCRIQEILEDYGPIGQYNLLGSYEEEIRFDLSAAELNEQIIHNLWDQHSSIGLSAFPLVLSQAYAIYREQMATAS